MIVTFCGHRDFQETDDVKGRLMSILAALAEKNETLICYTGGYGSFDRFAARCVKEAQKVAENIRNCLVVPYLTVAMQRELKEREAFFDEVIYPALENVPPRFAIIRRNEWMVERADLVIGYITHNFGGGCENLAICKTQERRTHQSGGKHNPLKTCKKPPSRRLKNFSKKFSKMCIKEVSPLLLYEGEPSRPSQNNTAQSSQNHLRAFFCAKGAHPCTNNGFCGKP